MSCIMRNLKYREEAEERSFMIKNGGVLMEKLIKTSRGKYYPFRCFSAKEIKAATNNFSRQNIIRHGAYDFYKSSSGGLSHMNSSVFTVYKGFLQDRSVTIVKYKNWGGLEYTMSNIVFPAKMCHKNSPKLIGCCIEMENPVVVFEAMKPGSLADRIHRWRQSNFEPLLWIDRLRIAMEVANVVAYLHFRFPRPVVFRNIKLSNILFNEEHIVKLFDFTLCVPIPEDKTCILDDDDMFGSVGYCVPEYRNLGYFNEKGDVFKFGTMLLEFLTGQVPVGNGPGESPYLRSHVLEYIEDNKFKDIVDPTVVGGGLSEEKVQQLRAFSDLAIRCTLNSPEHRPNMIDVAKELRQLYLSYSSC